MRKAIETAPRNGEFVFLEDAARGTVAVARWSAEEEQWIDENGKPSQLNATHWHSPQNPAADGTPSQLNAKYWQSQTPEQPPPAAKPGSTNVLPMLAGFAACLLIGVASAPFVYRSDLGQWFLHQTASENGTELQALRREQERSDKLANDVTSARREAESQGALVRKASEAADREKEASERALAGLRQSLQQELLKNETLTRQFADAQRGSAAQAASMRKMIDDATRADGERERVIGELRQTLKQQEDQGAQAARREIEDATAQARQAEARAAEALKQERDKIERLRVELAAARREGEAHAATLGAATDETTRIKEASARVTDALRETLQQVQDKAERLAVELAAMRQEGEARTAKLGAELAEARSSLEAQTKAKAADDLARDNQLATVREELQKARAEATFARESFEAERTRVQQVEHRPAATPAVTRDRESRAPAAAPLGVGRPFAAAPSAQEPQTKAPNRDSAQPANSAMRTEPGVEPGSSQAVRLIARANLLLEQGNIGAARNVLDRAAEMGSAEALFWLAETYDPLVLSARNTFGTQSDIAKARELYSKALTGGVGQAKSRLEALK